jgi:pyridoxamine 5'-phosphate oxidase
MSEDKPRDAWLGEDPLPDRPVGVVRRWLDEAFAARDQDSPHAVALATVEPDGRPSVRMVLCHTIDEESGTFTIFTNRESAKGRALQREPRAAIVYNWPGRQARIEGRVAWTSDEQSDAYFASRPLDARLGAWASRQSEPIADRDTLLARIEETAARFDARREEDVLPRPPFWGGLTLTAQSVELWASRARRIHDRVLWRRDSTSDTWTPTRLQP